jgi:hypothetical protein
MENKSHEAPQSINAATVARAPADELTGYMFSGLPSQLGTGSCFGPPFEWGSFAGATELLPDPDIVDALVCEPTKV